MRLVVDLRRWVGVLRGRYVSSSISVDAKDRRRRVCLRSREVKLDTESRDAGWLCGEIGYSSEE